MKTTKTLLNAMFITALVVPSTATAMPAGDRVSDTRRAYQPNKYERWLKGNHSGIEGKVHDLVKQPVYNNNVKKLNFNLGDHVGIGAQASFQIKENLGQHQRAYQQKLNAAGKQTAVVKTGAAVNMNGGLGFSFGNVNVNFRAQTGAKFYQEQSVVISGGLSAKASAAKTLIKNNTVKLPTSLKRMKKQMKQGDLMVIEGWADVGASAGVGYNSTLARLGSGLAVVDFNAGLGISASRSRRVRATFKKLDDGKMMATFEEIPTKTRSVNLSAELAFRTNFKGEYGGDKLSDLAYGQLDDAIKDIASTTFGARMTRTEQSGVTVASHIFDLKTNLVLKDVNLRANRVNRVHQLDAKLFNFNLLHAARKMNVTDEWLHVRVKDNDTFVRISRGAYETKTDGFFPKAFGDGEKHFNRTMYVVQEERNKPTYNVHLEFGAQNDHRTKDRIIDGFFGAAKAMGGVAEKMDIGGSTVGMKKAQKELKRGMKHTSWGGAAHLNALGLKRVVGVKKEAYTKAFIKKYSAFSDNRIDYPIGGPSNKAIPLSWLNPRTVTAGTRNEIISLLKGNGGSNAHQRYMDLTHCDLAKDRRAFRAYNGIWNMIQTVKAAGTGKAKAEKFVSEARKAGGDIFELLVVLSAIAKPDGITLEKMQIQSMKGDQITGQAKFKTEGVAKDPRIVITKALAVPPPS